MCVSDHQNCMCVVRFLFCFVCAPNCKCKVSTTAVREYSDLVVITHHKEQCYLFMVLAWCIVSKHHSQSFLKMWLLPHYALAHKDLRRMSTFPHVHLVVHLRCYCPPDAHLPSCPSSLMPISPHVHFMSTSSHVTWCVTWYVT